MNNDAILKKYSGSQLKKLRLDNDMTQNEVAIKLMEIKKAHSDNALVTRQTISKYENGDRGMNLEIISDLATLFKVSVNYFFPNTNAFQEEISKQTAPLYSKILIDEDGFSLEIKTVTPFDDLEIEERQEIMDTAMEELLEIKKSIRKSNT